MSKHTRVSLLQITSCFLVSDSETRDGGLELVKQQPVKAVGREGRRVGGGKSNPELPQTASRVKPGTVRLQPSERALYNLRTETVQLQA